VIFVLVVGFQLGFLRFRLLSQLSNPFLILPVKVFVLFAVTLVF
jgi:hypothetical protein